MREAFRQTPPPPQKIHMAPSSPRKHDERALLLAFSSYEKKERRLRPPTISPRDYLQLHGVPPDQSIFTIAYAAQEIYATRT